MNDWNTYFRRVASSHRLTKAEVVECCRLGGIEITVSRAEAWKRAESQSRRYVCMNESEYDAFTRGLVIWARDAYDDKPAY